MQILKKFNAHDTTDPLLISISCNGSFNYLFPLNVFAQKFIHPGIDQTLKTWH
jgi:hypothetical protein